MCTTLRGRASPRTVLAGRAVAVNESPGAAEIAALCDGEPLVSLQLTPHLWQPLLFFCESRWRCPRSAECYPRRYVALPVSRLPPAGSRRSEVYEEKSVMNDVNKAGVQRVICMV